MFRSLTIALVVTLLSAGASYAREWERLGERHVGFGNDHDIIDVGRHEGRFKRLRLRVRDNDIKLNSIKVMFGNGEVEDIVSTKHPRRVNLRRSICARAGMRAVLSGR